MDYKTMDGAIVKSYIEEGNTEKIKLNLPLTADEYLSGNGEGVWCEIDSDLLERALKNPPALIPVKILNDSCYYPNLTWGNLVLAEFRNSNFRPVADRKELLFKYGPSITLEEKEELIKKIVQARKNMYAN